MPEPKESVEAPANPPRTPSGISIPGSPSLPEIFASKAIPGIYKKMHHIMTDTPVLRKLGTLELGANKKIPFLQVDLILEEIKPFFIENRVLIVPTLVERHTDIGTAPNPPDITVGANHTPLWNGKIPSSNYREVVIYDFTFYDIDDGSHVTARVSGEAKDTQDKASGKAITSAFKSCLIKTFMLITGDPEIENSKDEEQEAPAPVTRGEQQRNAASPSARVTAAQTARAAAKPAATTPADTAEKPTISDPETNVDLAKGKLRDAVDARKAAGSPISKEEVDRIGFRLFEAPRTGWINHASKITKIAQAIQAGEV